MRVLALAGTGALALTLPLAGLISVMLAIVTLSYRQTIKAYPKGASSYIVASDNLGSGAGRARGGRPPHRLRGDRRRVGVCGRRGDQLDRSGDLRRCAWSSASGWSCC